MQTHSRATTAVGHTVGMIAQAALVVAIVSALALAAATVTGKGPFGAGSALAGKTQTSWISLAQSSGGAAAQPSLGSQVAFDAGYPTTVKTPRVAVKCYQDGTLVYAEARNVDESFQLGGAGSDWLRSGGAASCTADLFYFTYKGQIQTYHWLASTDFAAAA